MRSPLPFLPGLALSVTLSVALSLALPLAASAVTFESGGVEEISSDIGGDATVRDSPGGLPTTLNVFPGAVAGQLSVEGLSVANVLPGSVFTTSVRGVDTATVRLYGGEAPFVDSNDTARVFIAGGTFETTGGVLRIFGGEVQVTGGSFQKNGGSTTVSVDTGAELRFCGGAVLPNIVGDATIGVSGGGTVLVEGGTFSRLVNGGSAFVYGGGFEARDTGGSLVLSGTGVLNDFSGTITGTLADATPLAIDVLNTGASLVTLRDPPPESLCDPLPPPPLPGGGAVPATSPGGALVLLAGLAAMGTLLLLRRRAARPD